MITCNSASFPGEQSSVTSAILLGNEKQTINELNNCLDQRLNN